MTSTALKDRPTKAKFDVKQAIQDKVIAAMEAGSNPWKAPYLAGGLPLSASTGKPYRGVNTILLWIADRGYASRYWATYKKISELGGQVRKGEKSTMVTFWKRLIVDNPKYGQPGEPQRKAIPFLRFYNVFNVEQADWADGMPERFVGKTNTDTTPQEAAEAIIEGYKAQQGAPTFVSEDQTMAWYSPLRDVVNVPLARNMVGMDEYYSTTFHEMTHSTGHASRLKRDGVDKMQPGHRGDSYAFEELVAEFGAAMLAGIAGIENVVPNSAAYLKGWASRLQGSDAGTVLKAAGQAQKAVDHVLGVIWEDKGDEEG